MRTFTAIAIVACIGLNSCHSFNRYEFHGASAKDLSTDEMFQADAVTEEPPVQDTKTMSRVCPIYRLPTLPPSPDLPYDQLAKVASNPNQPYDKMSETYIKQLREYIALIKELIRQSQDDYLRNCADYLSMAHQNSSIR